nr:hypothetical protein [Tanacetum cinerariifolium]
MLHTVAEGQFEPMPRDQARTTNSKEPDDHSKGSIGLRWREWQDVSSCLDRTQHHLGWNELSASKPGRREKAEPPPPERSYLGGLASESVRYDVDHSLDNVEDGTKADRADSPPATHHSGSQHSNRSEADTDVHSTELHHDEGDEQGHQHA